MRPSSEVSRYLSEVPSRERCCVNAVCELQCVRCGNGRGEKRQVKSDLFLIVLFIFHGKVLKVKNFATNPVGHPAPLMFWLSRVYFTSHSEAPPPSCRSPHPSRPRMRQSRLSPHPPLPGLAILYSPGSGCSSGTISLPTSPSIRIRPIGP